MVYWNELQRAVIKHMKEHNLGVKDIPEEFRQYKCHACKAIVDEPICPRCGIQTMQMCPLDHCCCEHEVESSIEHCPICGEIVCPQCGCHDVVGISRVTGYLQDVSGWNVGKQQELKDRHRINIEDEVV